MAEEIKETGKSVETPPSTEKNAEIEKSIAERLAQLEVENKKLKSAVDKASSEASDYKKRWKATQSESEQRAMEKAEADAQMKEELQALKRENIINGYAKSFLALGYTEKMAEEASIAQYDNDTDTLFRIQSSYIADREASIKADLMKSMPTPPIGSEGETSVSKDDFNKMGYLERLEFKNKYPEIYKKYNS